MTCEKLREKFIANGWADTVRFEEVTKEYAEEKGLLFAIDGIAAGKQYFRMVSNGNVFDEKGRVCCYNINAIFATRKGVV